MHYIFHPYPLDDAFEPFVGRRVVFHCPGYHAGANASISAPLNQGWTYGKEEKDTDVVRARMKSL